MYPDHLTASEHVDHPIRQYNAEILSNREIGPAFTGSTCWRPTSPATPCLDILYT